MYFEFDRSSVLEKSDTKKVGELTYDQANARRELKSTDLVAKIKVKTVEEIKLLNLNVLNEEEFTVNKDKIEKDLKSTNVEMMYQEKLEADMIHENVIFEDPIS